MLYTSSKRGGDTTDRVRSGDEGIERAAGFFQNREFDPLLDGFRHVTKENSNSKGAAEIGNFSELNLVMVAGILRSGAGIRPGESGKRRRPQAPRG